MRYLYPTEEIKLLLNIQHNYITLFSLIYFNTFLILKKMY